MKSVPWPGTTSIVVFLALFVFVDAALTKCTYSQSCGCNTDKGYIDLMPMEQSTPYSCPGRGGILIFYYWSPCSDFTKSGKTVGALQYVDEDNTFDIGVHSEASSDIDNGEAVFKMKAADGQRFSTFKCICGQSTDPVLKFDKEDPIGHYFFDVTSSHCCPVPFSENDKLSVGSILLITALVSVCLYLIIGIGIQVGLRKASGKERIPNVEFWQAVPGLIKDGFKFTFSGGKSANYQEI